MAAQSSGAQNVDVRELFNMLESNDINVSNDITKLVQENLASTKEAWLVCSLVDYYYISHSERTLQIIKEVREPHDKHLVDKLNEGLKSVEHRLPAMKILLSLACKQPIWVHKLVTQQVFHSIIKTLKTETDIPVVMTGVMALTVLLPSVPALIGNQLTEIFNIFSRLIAFNERKPGNVPDVFLLHLQVALYSLFHRLYGMFPYNFLTYLRHHYNKKENAKVFDEFVKPMLDRVRLHPHLITSSRDHEVSSKRWRQMEAQDVVIECAKMSLDMTEGMWEELTCPIITPRPMLIQPKKPSLKLITSEKDDSMLNKSHQQNPPSLELSPPCLNADGVGLWSPSVVVGLSTPPPSQQTTPLSNCLDASRYTYGNTPLATPPVDTPRAISPSNDELDKSFGRNSRGLHAAKGSDLKRLSTGSMVSAKGTGTSSVTEGKPSSVPPSPLRAEFTSDPPQGIFKPVRQAIRELKFDAINEGQQTLEQEKSETTKEGGENDKSDLMESFSMDTLPKVMEHLAGQQQNTDNDDDDDDDDQEVSALTSHNKVTLTAESVQQFMKKVNRIRFNSLTASNSIPEKQKFGARSRSCPHLPKIDSFESEGDDTDSVSRSASATLKVIASPNTCGKSSSDQDKSLSAYPSEKSCPLMTVRNGVKHPVDTGPKTAGSVSVAVPKEKSPSSCPVMSAGHDPSPDSNKVVPNMYIEMMKSLLQPGSMLVCQKCNQGNSDGSPLSALGPAGMPTSFSPPELLDRHLHLGGEVHAKQLSKIPITSHDSISWTHFGGMPPADEVNILRGQIFMIQNQLMYERHKRELHAKKNRRLLRKIANAKAVEEQNNAMADQLTQYETEIQHLRVSLQILQEDNRRYKESQESNEYESKVQMRSCLAENEDLKSAKSELTTLLVRQREEQDLLKQRLQETESKLFKSEKEKSHLQEEVQFTQKLKEQVFTLHKEVLLMGELHQHYQEQINSARIHRKTKHEQDLHVTAQSAEIAALKKQLKSVTMTSEASQARANQLEANIKTKDIALAEIKQSLADVITNHQEELKAIEEKYQTMVKVNQQLEGKILRLYSQVDELGQPRQSKDGPRSKEESPDSTASKEGSPTRERTGSDPTIVTNISKTPLCKMTSVPTYCEMRDQDSDMLAAGSSQIKHQPKDTSHTKHQPGDLLPLTTPPQEGDMIERPMRTMELDTGSLSSRESGMFTPHRSVYSEGEDHSLSSRGSNLLDSGYSA